MMNRTRDFNKLPLHWYVNAKINEQWYFLGFTMKSKLHPNAKKDLMNRNNYFSPYYYINIQYYITFLAFPRN